MSKKRYGEGVTCAEPPQVILHSYFRGGIGRQKDASAASGILASTLSSMAHGRVPITLEAAVLLDVATESAVRAQDLCPARADVLDKFVRLHAPAKT